VACGGVALLAAAYACGPVLGLGCTGHPVDQPPFAIGWGSADIWMDTPPLAVNDLDLDYAPAGVDLCCLPRLRIRPDRFSISLLLAGGLL
jgi:hypothetical protein